VLLPVNSGGVPASKRCVTQVFRIARIVILSVGTAGGSARRDVVARVEALVLLAKAIECLAKGHAILPRRPFLVVEESGGLRRVRQTAGPSAK
jgi:hypothetical protein